MAEEASTGYARALSSRDQIGCYAAGPAIDLLEDRANSSYIVQEGVKARLKNLCEWASSGVLKLMLTMSPKKRMLYEQALQESVSLGDSLQNLSRNLTIGAITEGGLDARTLMPPEFYKEGFPAHIDADDFVDHLQDSQHEPRLNRRMEAIRLFQDALMGEIKRLMDVLGVENVGKRAA